MQKPRTAREQMLDMAGQPGGASSNDFQAALGLNPCKVQSHCAALHHQCRLHKAKVAGRKLQYFASRQAALEHSLTARSSDSNLMPRCDTPGPSPAPKLHAIGARVKSLAQQPGLGQPPLRLPGSDPIRAGHAGTVIAEPSGRRLVGDAEYSLPVITICPPVTHDPRYQVDPASRPFGAGFAAVGIGRDVQTGRVW